MKMKIEATRKAVIAVLLAREHLPFIRGWAQHHLAQGWQVYIYDNTGSRGSNRKGSVFASSIPQCSGMDKRGNFYAAYSSHLGDNAVRQELLKALEGLPVTVVAWRPRNAEGLQIHGQVEAYVDFIRTQKERFDWAAFIDADEYLETAAGFSWDGLIRTVESMGCFRIVIEGHQYESRWTIDGKPRSLQSLRCCGMQNRIGEIVGSKNIVKISQVLRADIHWMWKMSGGNLHARPDILQYYFKHYNGCEASPYFKIVNSTLALAIDGSLPVT